MKSDYAILGGGVAGLSAANRLADRGADAVLIDAGGFPAHKVCGEFLSPECIPILRGWGIDPPVLIHRASYFQGGRRLTFDLPEIAAGFARYELDHQLAQRAELRGARVLTETRVDRLEPPEQTGLPEYIIRLNSGETLHARVVLIGTGRLTSSKPTMKYAGYKMHFRGLDLKQTLMMFAFPGAYLGVSNVGPDTANLACVATVTAAAAYPRAHDHIQALCAGPGGEALNALLESGEPTFEEWMTTRIPEFGIRKVPNWPDALFIGDAAGSIHPATGNGLGMAMTGGIMAADMALDGKAAQYATVWRDRYRSRLFWGRWLHRLMIRPALSCLAHTVGRRAVRFPAWMFRKTRENGSAS